MIDKLNHLVEDISGLNSKLVLLIGPPRSGKSNLLQQLSVIRHVRILNIGAVLGRQLLAVPGTRRHLHVADVVKDLADDFASHELLLMDNLELLFDRSLRLSPLDLLRHHAHSRRVIAVWPGEFENDRLSYAATGHPEHQDYGIGGLVPFIIH
ncbi:MAG: BREX-3 system P-loop-containing protein BrxF [Rhodospirillales bacterium]|nr:BREX-3 system P-loop-containing protein BrxF [Rhodospirillales bacterium]